MLGVKKDPLVLINHITGAPPAMFAKRGIGKQIRNLCTDSS